MSPQWFGPCTAPVQLQCLDDLQGVFSYKCWGSAWHNRNHRPILRHRSKLIPAWKTIAYMALRMVFIPVQHGCHWKPSWWLSISTFKAILRVFFFWSPVTGKPFLQVGRGGGKMLSLLVGSPGVTGKLTFRLERFGDIDICHKIGDPREEVRTDDSTSNSTQKRCFFSRREDIREIRESHETLTQVCLLCRLPDAISYI